MGLLNSARIVDQNGKPFMNDWVLLHARKLFECMNRYTILENSVGELSKVKCILLAMQFLTGEYILMTGKSNCTRT